jgi:nucleotide-binding universal stress UspA family protein
MGISEHLQPQVIARANRFERILVPLDGSEAAESVLPTAAALCRKHGSQAVLVRIVEPSLADQAAERSSIYLSQIAATLEKQGIQPKIVVRVGPVQESLLDVAAEKRISLIVTAGGEKRLRAGSIPILAVPVGKAPSPRSLKDPVRTMLVPVEGDGRADEVVPVAVDFGVAFGSDLALLLEVVPQAFTGRAEAEQYRAAEEHLGRLARRFETKHISTTSVIRHGNPVDAILDLVRDQGVDVIVWSTRWGDSVTEGVLRQSEVPVLATE